MLQSTIDVSSTERISHTHLHIYFIQYLCHIYDLLNNDWQQYCICKSTSIFQLTVCLYAGGVKMPFRLAEWPGWEYERRRTITTVMLLARCHNAPSYYASSWSVLAWLEGRLDSQHRQQRARRPLCLKNLCYYRPTAGMGVMSEAALQSTRSTTPAHAAP